jgi:two-component sensor histidine kinase
VPARFDIRTEAQPGIEISTDRAISTALIVNELITNALKYAFPSGRGGTIRIGLTLTDDDHAALSVEDEGAGYAEDASPKGTGLGLAIVKKIMEDHAGALVLEDSASGGAKVSLVFPNDLKSGSPRDQTGLNDTMEKREALFHGS